MNSTVKHRLKNVTKYLNWRLVYFSSVMLVFLIYARGREKRARKLETWHAWNKIRRKLQAIVRICRDNKL